MKQRIITGSLLVLVLVAFLVMQSVTDDLTGTPFAFDFLVVAISVLATVEFVNALMKLGRPAYFSVALAYPITLFGMVMLSLIWSWSAITLFLVALLIMAVFYAGTLAWNITVNNNDLTNDAFRMSTGMTTKQFAFFKSNNTLMSFIYPNFLLFFLYLINHINSIGFANITSGYSGVKIALFGIILVFVVSMLSDTCAFAFGKIIKGPKLIPKISPNKTWAGAGGGLVGGILGAIIIFLIFGSIYPESFIHLSWWQFMFIGIFGSLFTQGGDLFASWLKRKAQIKDFGNLLPGHGGILDRIDGLIFNIPLIFTCLLLML